MNPSAPRPIFISSYSIKLTILCNERSFAHGQKKQWRGSLFGAARRRRRFCFPHIWCRREDLLPQGFHTLVSPMINSSVQSCCLISFIRILESVVVGCRPDAFLFGFREPLLENLQDKSIHASLAACVSAREGGVGCTIRQRRSERAMSAGLRAPSRPW